MMSQIKTNEDYYIRDYKKAILSRPTYTGPLHAELTYSTLIV